ncbi:MAG: hypothetical protein M3N47_12480, partial [Chloroflexota bacterium]|nr:hypothetical protein [Chloroflexota bacterium]
MGLIVKSAVQRHAGDGLACSQERPGAGAPDRELVGMRGDPEVMLEAVDEREPARADQGGELCQRRAFARGILQDLTG